VSKRDSTEVDFFQKIRDGGKITIIPHLNQHTTRKESEKEYQWVSRG
jgi:hypothetical protein